MASIGITNYSAIVLTVGSPTASDIKLVLHESLEHVKLGF
jgi:hypothetical protein